MRQKNPVVRISIGTVLLVSIKAGLAGLAAQTTPPRPAVRIEWQNPGYAYSSWPVDLNRDGRSDIVSATAADGTLLYAIGAGDGTFAAPVHTSIPAAPIGTGDFNNDGNVDVVVTGVAILRSNGNGTFGAAYPVTGPPAPPSLEDPTFPEAPPRDALVADFNGDGFRDVALLNDRDSTVEVYPGRGDFTFGARAVLAVDVLPRAGIVADFNGDGRRDIAVAGDGDTTVLLNAGALAFTARQVGLGFSSVTAADMNRDGRVDLVLARIGSYAGFASGGVDGSVSIMAGNGDGTFQPARHFSTGKQTSMTVVAGDFNGDGLIDVATGNRSWEYHDRMCAPAFFYSDSITILPGLGNGALGAPAAFRLADSPGDKGPYVDGHNALKTSDFNGDGRTDLLASPGALLLNVALAPNRAPSVNGGPDREMEFGETVFLVATSGDADGDWLEYEWSREGEIVDRISHTCQPGSTTTYTVTVRDGRGGVATDTVNVLMRDFPTTFTGNDVGAVAAPGSSSFDGEVHTVRGSGADIWGSADEFFWIHEPHSGDFETYARVLSVQQVDVWTKAGLIIRDGTGPGARHASLFVTPTSTKGLAFQRRPTAGGSSIHTAGPAVTAPIWIRLTRTGNTISAYYSTTAQIGTWQLIGRQMFSTLSDTLEVGLAVSSHRDGVVATARFDNVVIGRTRAWLTGDIGAVGVAGRQDWLDAITLEGSGADIWGTADAFRYMFHEWTLDGAVTTRVRSVENTNAWAKAGLMFRESLAANARHVMVVVTPGKGVAMQYRSAAGGTSAQVAAVQGTAPEWVRLRRSGNTFVGQASEDGVTWRTIGSVTIPMNGDAWTGLVVTSHNNSTLATAEYDNYDARR